MTLRISASRFRPSDAQLPTAAGRASCWVKHFQTRRYGDVPLIFLFHPLKLRATRAMVWHLTQDGSAIQLKEFNLFRRKLNWKSFQAVCESENCFLSQQFAFEVLWKVKKAQKRILITISTRLGPRCMWCYPTSWTFFGAVDWWTHGTRWVSDARSICVAVPTVWFRTVC